jgi:hypothetical protein
MAFNRDLSQLANFLEINADGTFVNIIPSDKGDTQLGIGTNNPTAKLDVLGSANVSGNLTAGSINASAGVITATTFVGALTGLASSATELETGRTIAITGDLTYTSGSFNGTDDVTGTGTLATVNSNTGQFGSQTLIPVVTVNAKGLITAVSTAAVGTALTVAGDSGSIDINLLTETLTVAGGTNLTSSGTGNAVTVDLDDNISLVSVVASGIVTASQFSTGASGSAIGINTNTISGPETIIIDPAGVGDNTGAVRIKGDLLVDGEQFIVNSTTIELADFIVGIASTATTDTLADGAGIKIGPDNTLTYDHSNTALKSSENLNLASSKTYKIDGTDVLSATTLGSAVVNSSLTSLGTIASLVATNGTITNGTVTNLTGTAGTITTFNSTTGTITNGTITNGTVTNLTGTAGTITTFNSTDSTITNGTVTNLTGTAGTITTFNSTVGTITNLTSTNINASGIVTATSGFVGNLTGTAATTTNIPNLTGDITSINLTTTLATVNSNTGQFGSQTLIPVITVNAKGLVTAVETAAVGTALTVAGDSGSVDIDLLSETLTISGGTNLTSSGTGNAVTVNLDDNISLTGVIATNGTVTNLTGTAGTITTFDSTDSTITNLTSTNVSVSGVSTLGIATATQLYVAGVTTTGNLTVNGTAFFAAGLSANSSSIFENILATGDLDVDGYTELDDVNVSGTLNVTGISTFAGAIDANGDLDVDGYTELDDVNVSGGLNVVGVSTFTDSTITNGTITNGTITNLTGTAGTITTFDSTNGTVTNLTGTAGTITTFNSTDSTITNGTITNGTVTNLTGTAGTITTFNSTNGTVTNLTGTAGTITTFNSTVGTITNLSSTNINASGIVTATSGFVGNVTGTATTTTNIPNLTGDITSINLATTLATVNSNVGSFGSQTLIPVVTVNAKGLVTAVSTAAVGTALTVSGDSGSIDINLLTETLTISGGTNLTSAGTGNAVTVNLDDNISLTGVTATNGTITNLTGTAGTITTFNSTDSTITNGTITNGTVTNLTGTAGTITTFNSTDSTITNGTITNLSATGINASGIVTAAQFVTGASGSAIGINTNTISGPAVITIDPAGVGDNTGLLVIKGDLQIDGTTTTINSTTVTVDDKNIQIADGAVNDAAADGAGITITSGDGNKTFQFEDAGDNLGSSENLNVASGKVYKVNNTEVLSATTLGSGVVNSSLTSLGTIASLVATNGTITNGTVTNLTGTAGTITTFNSTNGTVTNLTGTAGTITTFNSTTGTITNGTITNGTITNLTGTAGTITNLTGTAGTITTFNSTVGTITNLSSTNVNASGIVTATSGFVGNLTGTAATTTNIPNLTGDITSINLVTTLATVNSNTGQFGSQTLIPVVTVNAKGLVTAVETAAVGTALTVSGDSGSVDIDLLTETLTISGGTNLTSAGTGNAVTVNLDDNISLTGVTATNGTITNLTGTAGTITTFNSTDSTITNGTVTNGTITNLTGTAGTITTFDSTNGTITNLTGTAGTITTFNSTDSTITNGTITNGTVTNLTGTAGTITTFNSTVGTITNLSATDINASGIVTVTTGLSLGGYVSIGNSTGDENQILASTGVGVSWKTFEDLLPQTRTGLTTSASASQTLFNFVYNVNFLDVFVNGVKLSSGEFTATNGTTVTLSESAFESDTVEFVSYATLGAGTGQVSSLNDLSDVTLSSTTTGQLLAFDGSGFVNTSNINISGISTLNNVVVGGATTALVVNGDARITGILTIGTSTLTLDGSNNQVNVGSATTITTSGYKVGSDSFLHSTGLSLGSGNLTVGNVNSSGIITATQFVTGASGSAIGINTNTISGPATITIDPAGVGDNTGLVVIKGDLQIDGTTTTINSTTVTVDDKNIVLGSGAVNDAAADGSGITIESGNGNKTFQFEDTGDNLGSSENLNVASGKVYKVNNTEVLSSTTLGSGIINSSLTSVGTLTNLSVGNVNSSGIITATTFVGALTGTATSTTNIPNLTGDITSANTVTTLATVNSNVGSFGSGGAIPTITVNAKGLVTGVTTTAVNPANDGTLTLAVSGTGLSGSQTFSANQSSSVAFTVTSNATSANTASTIVARDGSGNFTAGTITATTFSGSLANTLTLNTSGTGLSGSTTYNNSGAATFTVASNATSANTASTIVARDGSGNFTAGTITATNFNSTSDINLKENIKQVESASELVSKLEGVHFSWKETGKETIGVIAQQIEEHLPQLVQTGDTHKTVNYNGLIGVLIEAVKEQGAQIASLQGELNELKVKCKCQ